MSVKINHVIYTMCDSTPVVVTYSILHTRVIKLDFETGMQIALEKYWFKSLVLCFDTHSTCWHFYRISNINILYLNLFRNNHQFFSIYIQRKMLAAPIYRNPTIFNIILWVSGLMGPRVLYWRLSDGTIVSSTKHLMFQVFFFHNCTGQGIFPKINKHRAVIVQG